MTDTTHYPGCYDSGPRHYECALLEVKKRLRIEQSDYALNMEFKRREWVGLTEEEIGCLTAKFIKSIEAKLKEKNGG